MHSPRNESETAAAEVQQQFMAEFDALLKRWDAVISAKDHYQGYAECGEDIRINIEINWVYKDGALVRPGADFFLGSYHKPE